jgi:cardiolipin synthase
VNLPNALTLFRFALIPVYFLAFYGTESPHKVGALFVLLIAGATDVLDGYLARSNGQVTQTGQLLDPLADKTLMLVVLFSLIQSNRVPWLVAGLLLFRDATMILGATFFYFQGKRAVPKANRWGKATTICYYATICSIILAWPSESAATGMLWFTLVLSYITSLLYVASMRLIDVRRRIV